MAKQFKILLVEDEPDIAELYSMKLEGEGFNVVVANDGMTAIEIIKHEKPDLTLLDLVMPDINGYETLRLIKKEDAAKSVSVVKHLRNEWRN